MKTILPTIAFVLLLAAVLVAPQLAKAPVSETAFGEATRVCNVTHTNVAVGPANRTTLLAAGTRQWAIIQQPVNATNTVAIAIGTTATSSPGFELTPATTTSPVPMLSLGYATDYPTSAIVYGWTTSASSSVRVTECK